MVKYVKLCFPLNHDANARYKKGQASLFKWPQAWYFPRNKSKIGLTTTTWQRPPGDNSLMMTARCQQPGSNGACALTTAWQFQSVKDLAMTAWLTTTAWQQQRSDDDGLTITVAWQWWPGVNNLAIMVPGNYNLTRTWQWRPSWQQWLDNNDSLMTIAWQ